MARTKNPQKILAVVTSTSHYATAGYRTGLWLGELTHFYDTVTEAGHEVIIASIEGGQVPIDPESLSTPMLAMGGTGKRYADREFMDLLENTRSVRDVSADDVDAIYLTGGHGVMYDFGNSALAHLVSDIAAQGKIVSAVCHGPAGLLEATTPEGRPLIEGKKVTGFSWAEEKVAKRDEAVPFRLDQELTRRGASYTKSRIPMKPKVVRDGLLITGQNPTSASGVAEELLKTLKKVAKGKKA